MTVNLNSYLSMKQSIAQAREWEKHLTAADREGKRGRIHSIGANPNICIQYVTSGQNYWEAKQEGGEVFAKYLNDAIAEKLASLTAEAIAKMEKDLDKWREKAKQEYANLFGSNLAA